MLNIALIDVGAGTSDICITRDGSIIAYGMIPCAGDEMTETIVQEYLVDFATAEKIKLASTTESSCTYEDIMGISHTVPAEKVWKLTEPVVNKLATDVAAKIKELNGNKTVSAAFVVGGGGKIHGFTAKLAEQLDIVPERCALRGEEVMKNINFKGSELEKDPLLVTPIGICLNYYQQKNNFIMLHFNGEMMKLYDNGSLTVVDAAMQAGYSAEDLFPRRGKEITFTVNGIQRMVRGIEGESAVVTINGQPASMQSALTFNCDVTLVPSTEGEAAISTIADLAEYTSADISFNVCGRRVTCPKFVEVNGSMEPSDYKIKDGDVIESRGYYTVSQLAEFMDVHIDERYEIMVNNRVATLETLCYENFSVDWTTTDGNVYLGQYDYADSYEEEMANKTAEERAAAAEFKPGAGTGAFGKAFAAGGADITEDSRPGNVTDFNKAYTKLHQELKEITVTVNGEPMTLKDKSEYIFIDVFNLIDFDTNQANGRTAELLLNGEAPQFIAQLNDGDDIVVRWKEKEA